jgi:hypothetical protein
MLPKRSLWGCEPWPGTFRGLATIEDFAHCHQNAYGTVLVDILDLPTREPSNAHGPSAASALMGARHRV